MPDLDDLTDLAKLALDIGENLFLDWLCDSDEKKENPPKKSKKAPSATGDPWDQKPPRVP